MGLLGGTKAASLMLEPENPISPLCASHLNRVSQSLLCHRREHPLQDPDQAWAAPERAGGGTSHSPSGAYAEALPRGAPSQVSTGAAGHELAPPHGQLHAVAEVAHRPQSLRWLPHGRDPQVAGGPQDGGPGSLQLPGTELQVCSNIILSLSNTKFGFLTGSYPSARATLSTSGDRSMPIGMRASTMLWLDCFQPVMLRWVDQIVEKS